MKRTENMIKCTENKKNETIEKVEAAIKLIKSQGKEVTRKDLLEEAGVSSAVLSKPHMKEILKKHQVLMYKPTFVAEQKGGESYNQMNKQLITIEKKIQKKDHQIEDLKAVIETKKKYIDKLNNEIKQLNYENEILRGKNQRILEYLYRNGMDDNEIEDLFKY